MHRSCLLLLIVVVGVIPVDGDTQTCTNIAIAQSTPTDHFAISGDGTVTHSITGLVWKRCLEGQIYSDNGTPDNALDDQCTGGAIFFDWEAALERAQAVNVSGFAGYNDWRVPNMKELKSIVEYCRHDPAINTDVFPGNQSDDLWSSSPVLHYDNDFYGNGNDSWFVSFDVGYDSYTFRHYTNRLQLVRTNQ